RRRAAPARAPLYQGPGRRPAAARRQAAAARHRRPAARLPGDARGLPLPPALPGRDGSLRRRRSGPPPACRRPRGRLHPAPGGAGMGRRPPLPPGLPPSLPPVLPPILEVRGLRKVYRQGGVLSSGVLASGGGHAALAGVSLALRPQDGKVLAIVGESGSGKTT